jgi:hypothetical protein
MSCFPSSWNVRYMGMTRLRYDGCGLLVTAAGMCWLLCRILPLKSSEARRDTERSGKNATPGLDKTKRREKPGISVPLEPELVNITGCFTIPKHKSWKLAFTQGNLPLIFERGSVNRLQMDMRRKTCDIWNFGEISCLFLYISSTNLHTCPIPLPMRQIRNIEVFCLRHFRASVSSSATFERPLENFSTHSWTALSDRHFPP